MISVDRIVRYAKLKIFGPKMTQEAHEFIIRYRQILDDAMLDADQFMEKHADSDMVEFLKSSKQFMDDMATMQDKNKKSRDLYLPIHTMLYMLCKKQKPSRIIETGVEKGGSTYAILKALNTVNINTYLYSIDIAENYTYKNEYVAKIGPLVTDHLKKRWKFVHGDAQKILGTVLEETGELDAFMALQGHTYEVQKHEGDTAWPHIKSGGIFVLDRPDWNEGMYLKEFLAEHGSEVAHHETYKEGAVSDPFEFTVIIKK